MRLWAVKLSEKKTGNQLCRIGLWFGIFSQGSLGAFAQEVEDIRDIRPPVSYPVNWLLWFIFFAAVILVSAGFFFLRRRRSFHIERPPVCNKLPWEIAVEALSRLREKGYPAKGCVKEYYVELSDILRRYIEDRFFLKAPEMTTEEFLESLKGSDYLHHHQKERLGKFLTGCDMVKFAKYRASIHEMDDSFELVEKFINETIDHAATTE